MSMDSYPPLPFDDVAHASAQRRAAPPEQPEGEPDGRPRWRVNLVLFLATVASVFFMGAAYAIGAREPPEQHETWLSLYLDGWVFAVPLMAILLVHEFGHYIAARIHKVDASLPYFLPLPLLSPFGTMGAVIAMRGRIESRRALLDIGASGPLAGLVVAIPVLIIGLSLSRVAPNATEHYTQEGQSLLYLALKRLVLGPIPEGHDVWLHPTAFAGWAGLLVTMINLLPWGQLDGGHVAYALFGRKQNRYARIVRMLLPPLFLLNLGTFLVPVLRGTSTLTIGGAFGNSLFWLVWYGVLGLIGRLSGGADHPPVGPEELGPGRKAVGWITLGLFAALFMPVPYAVY